MADALSLAGHRVELVTPQYSLGEDIGTTLRAVLMERLLRQGVTITVLTAPVAISAEGVQVAHVLTGELRTLTADHALRAVDGLLTGLHEPEASHLDLLTAFLPPEYLRRAYEEAVRRRYLWHEFGDLNLIL